MGEGNMFIKSRYSNMYLQPLDSYKAVNSIKIKQVYTKANKAGNNSNTLILLENSGSDTVDTNGLFINYTFLKTRNERFSPPVIIPLQEKQFPPGYKKNITLPMLLPEKPGTYHLVYSIVQPPFTGSFASPFYKVVVE
jgi:hypothetical protein